MANTSSTGSAGAFSPAALKGLTEAQASAARSGGLPPVHLWTPAFCGDLDMVIHRDGSWSYMGSPIGRAAMVRLFSTILKREDNAYFLVTPVEKVGITVEDAPFVAILLDVEGNGRDQRLRFTTNVGDETVAGAQNPIRVEETDEGPAIYVHVRAGLEARLNRPVYYQLVDLGVEEQRQGAHLFGVWSDGTFFPLGEVDWD